MSLGNKIAELRKRKSMKQGELAKKIDVSQAYLSLVEKDRKYPSKDLLDRISEVLGIPSQVLHFLSMNEDDVSEDKREMFKLVLPAVNSMIEQVFVKD